MLKAFKDGGRGLTCTIKYDAWLYELEQDVIQAEFGYEPGEFTVYSTHWAALYEEGLTPRQAWRRAAAWLALAAERGHVLKYYDDEPGRTDLFVTTGGFHNGPGCVNCGWTECMHCDWKGENIPVCTAI